MDRDIDRVLRSTSIASLLGEREKEGGSKEKEKEKGKEKEKEKEKDKDSHRHGRHALFADGEQLIHLITSNDTLEGIAVKYGVQVGELKRVNKLWAKGDMFARKSLIIPCAQDPSDDIVWRFSQAAKCQDSEARSYLQRSNFHFSAALRLYREEHPKRTRKNGESTTPPQQMDEEERIKDLESQFEEISLASSPEDKGKVRLRQVERKVKERFEKEEEQLFDL